MDEFSNLESLVYIFFNKLTQSFILAVSGYALAIANIEELSIEAIN